MAISGHVDEISRGIITGWAVDTGPPCRPAEVSIIVNGQTCARLTGSIYRPDLQTLHPSSTGRFGFEHHFSPPLSAFKDNHIRVGYSADGTVLPRGEKVLAAVRSSAPWPSVKGRMPIFVNGAGRSGSTMLMKYLSLHPAVVVARRHPYEVKLASYYAAALGVLSATADRENSTDPERMISQHLHVGFNPYNRPSYYSIAKNHKAVEHYFEVEAPARTASTFRDLVLRYYELLADDEGKPSADCFAEKITLHERARLGVRALFPKVRELVLVRDPRDLLCSARAFWGLDPASSLASVAHASRALLDLYQAAEPDVRFVRYEDLVMEPTRTMADVFAFIGLYPSHAPEYGDQKGESFDIHATSKSPEASVGRWRKELSASEVSQCQDASRPYLLAFHYE